MCVILSWIFVFLGCILSSAGNVSGIVVECGCSLVGAIIIVSGFYAVMWGKAKEAEEGRLECSRKVPLLQNQTDVSV